MRLGPFQDFIPWVLYFILAGSHYLAHELAALAALIATVIFNFQGLRNRFLLAWSTLIYFSFLSIIYLLPVGIWFNQQRAFLLSNIILAVVMWVSIFIKKPFSMQYAKEKVDEIAWMTPTFKHINYVISTVWALALSLVAINGLLQSFAIISANWIVDLIAISAFVIAIQFSNWFPDWYQGFLFKKFSAKKEDVTANPYLQGNFAPIKDELHLVDLPVEGKLPKDLQGIYMRNGPNPAFDPISYTYPIDGDGMLHAIYINDGKAIYRNRFVETKGLIAEKRAGYALYGGISRPVPVSPRLIGKNGDPGPIKNGAFIHIIRHAEQYLAMYEAGPAYEISAQLQTMGEWCPNGASQPFNVNAHTRLDPETGELYAFTYNLQPPYLQYYVLDKTGNLKVNVPINKPTSSMMHDFILTKNYLIFFDCPAIFDFSGLANEGKLLCWNPELGVNIILVNRKNNEVFSIETEPFFVYHFANAYEQGPQIIIDYIRHEKLALGKDTTASKSPPLLYRAIINLNNKSVAHHQLDDHPVEFPRINEEKISSYHRYIYIPTRTSGNQFNAIIKYDLENKKTVLHDFGKNMEVGEAVFVASPNSSRNEEDEGYVALFVYNKNENKSDFVLLDAQAFTDEPVAKIKLPRRVPHGLHGSWMPGQW
ncbi:MULTISPECIES: carotenoid oxygenase family protein [unclassified Legionella]|uniref:carotenoid oxygenase family protein n=1 Tax=unclassified Legionella TaxID=2622702 RepID=UPI001054413A|nr:MULTISPECIES: carotenoid oxygenase family protein [unclassified Legionella]MDI9818902.1 carotenoid oxygenase family protein [Legionella sp. PL877]